jgi:hypothetical protein
LRKPIVVLLLQGRSKPKAKRIPFVEDGLPIIV